MVNDLEQVARSIVALFPEHRPDGTARAQSGITVAGNQSNLKLTFKVYREGGDDFCRLLLSTSAFVNRNASAAPHVKRSLDARIDSTELAIGVVAEPAFDADERYEALVFRIAAAIDGVVFNGQDFFNAAGEALISC